VSLRIPQRKQVVDKNGNTLKIRYLHSLFIPLILFEGALAPIGVSRMSHSIGEKLGRVCAGVLLAVGVFGAGALAAENSSGKSSLQFEPPAFFVKKLHGPPANYCTHDKDAWKFGFTQGESGTRFRAPVRDGSADAPVIKPEQKACREYRGKGQGGDALACCMAGFTKGYRSLKNSILDHVKERQSGFDDRQVNCIHEFNVGRKWAEESCNALAKGLCPQHTKANPNFMGCFSLGYYVTLQKCPAAEREREKLEKVMGDGALFDKDIKAGFNSPDGRPGAGTESGSANTEI
jgi:hypothetical protein